MRRFWDWIRGLWNKDEEEETYTSFELSVKLMREMLGSVDTSGLPKSKDEMEQEERKTYVRTVAAFFPEIIEGRIKRLVHAQEQLMARGSEDVRNIFHNPKDQIIFGRGTVNGIMLVFEDFQEDFQ